MWRELDDHVQRTVLRAATEQIEYVNILANHLHHFHFRHQIHKLRVSVALCCPDKQVNILIFEKNIKKIKTQTNWLNFSQRTFQHFDGNCRR